MIKPVVGQTLGPVKPPTIFPILKLCDSIAGENLKIVFKKNITSEQTARKRKFHPVEEPTVAGENFRPAVAGKIVGESKSRSDLVAPAKIYRTGKAR